MKHNKESYGLRQTRCCTTRRGRSCVSARASSCRAASARGASRARSPPRSGPGPFNSLNTMSTIASQWPLQTCGEILAPHYIRTGPLCQSSTCICWGMFLLFLLYAWTAGEPAKHLQRNSSNRCMYIRMTHGPCSLFVSPAAFFHLQSIAPSEAKATASIAYSLFPE